MERLFCLFLVIATCISGELYAQNVGAQAHEHAYTIELLSAPSNVQAKELVEYFNVIDPAAQVDFNRSCKQLIISQDHRSSITDIVEVIEAKGLIIQKVNMHSASDNSHSWNVRVTKVPVE